MALPLNADGQRPGDLTGCICAPPACLQILEMEVASIMKGAYDHFMQKEIHEQPESILQTMRGRVALRRNSRGDMVGVTAVSSLAKIE